MSQKFNEGDKVEWNYGGGTGTGTVEKVYTQKTTRKIDGSEITRDASEAEPAYYITQEDGGEVLKSQSELSKS